MSEKKPKGKATPPEDGERAGDVSDILGGLLGANPGGMPQGGSDEAPLAGGGSADLMGTLGGLMGGGSGTASGGGSADLMGMLGGLMGGGGASSGGGGSADLMGMLGGLLGGGASSSSGGIAASGPSLIQALLPLVLGMLGGGGGRSGEINLSERSSNELADMFGAAQSGQRMDIDQLRSSRAVQDMAAQTGADPDEVANAMAQLMQMLGEEK
jgi:hypothetical protein